MHEPGAEPRPRAGRSKPVGDRRRRMLRLIMCRERADLDVTAIRETHDDAVDVRRLLHDAMVRGVAAVAVPTKGGCAVPPLRR